MDVAFNGSTRNKVVVLQHASVTAGVTVRTLRVSSALQAPGAWHLRNLDGLSATKVNRLAGAGKPTLCATDLCFFPTPERRNCPCHKLDRRNLPILRTPLKDEVQRYMKKH